MGLALLSQESRQFIDENISAYEDLQVLLLMHEYPGRNWNAVDVAESLRIDPLSASNHLMNLHGKGLVAHEASRGRFYGFHYSPVPEAKEKKISAIAAAFEKARGEVVDYIFEKSRVQFRSFSDAFKVKKDE